MPVFKRVTITRPDDWHNHARTDAMLRAIVPYMSRWFGRVVWMPNTLPPITTAYEARRYYDEIVAGAGPNANPEFRPIMTLKLTTAMTPVRVQEAFDEGFRLVKYYPEGVTTNSQDGIHPDQLELAYPALEAMEKLGMVLCIHGEHPDAEVLDREKAFVPILEGLARRFDELKMVFEHVSSVDGVQAVCGLPDNVAATVTAHHLGSTLTDMLGGDLEPHMNCKPVIKNKLDRDVIQNVVFSGHPKFMLGSDSAGHPRGKKEASCCAAGAFTAPILLPLLAHLFYENSALGNLEAFTSLNGAQFHGMQPNKGKITLEMREGEAFEPEAPAEDIVTFPFQRDPSTKEPMKFNWHVVEAA